MKNIYKRKFTKRGRHSTKEISQESFIRFVKDSKSLTHVTADGGEGKSFFVENIVPIALPNFTVYNPKNIMNISYSDGIIIDGWDEIPIPKREDIKKNIIDKDLRGVVIFGRDDNQNLTSISSARFSMQTFIDGSDLPPRFYKWYLELDDEQKREIDDTNKNSKIFTITEMKMRAFHLSDHQINFLAMTSYKMLKYGSIMIKESHFNEDMRIFNKNNNSIVTNDQLRNVVSTLDGWVYFDNRTIFFFFASIFIKNISEIHPETLNGLFAPVFKLETYKELSKFISESKNEIIVSILEAGLYSMFLPNQFIPALKKIVGFISDEGIFRYFVNYNSITNRGAFVGSYEKSRLWEIIYHNDEFKNELVKEMKSRNQQTLIHMVPEKNKLTVDVNEIKMYLDVQKNKFRSISNVLRITDSKFFDEIINYSLELFKSDEFLVDLFDWVDCVKYEGARELIKKIGYRYHLGSQGSHGYVAEVVMGFDVGKYNILKPVKSNGYRREITALNDANIYSAIFRVKGIEEVIDSVKIMKKDADQLTQYNIHSAYKSFIEKLPQNEYDLFVERGQISKKSPKYELTNKEAILNILYLKEVDKNWYFEADDLSTELKAYAMEHKDEIFNLFKDAEALSFDLTQHKAINKMMQLAHLVGFRFSEGFIFRNYHYIYSLVAKHNLSYLQAEVSKRSDDWGGDYDWVNIQREILHLYDNKEQIFYNYYENDFDRIWSDFFLEEKWGKYNLKRIVKTKVYVNELMWFLTRNMENIPNDGPKIIKEWWINYGKEVSDNEDTYSSRLRRMAEMYRAGIPIKEVIYSVDKKIRQSIVIGAITDIAVLNELKFESGSRSVLPIEVILAAPNAKFIILKKIIEMKEIVIPASSFDLSNLAEYIVSTEILASLLPSIFKTADISLEEWFSKFPNSSLADKVSEQKSRLNVFKHYDSFFARFYKYSDSEMQSADFVKLIENEVIHFINDFIEENGFPSETPLQKILVKPLREWAWTRFNFVIHFEINPFGNDASNKAIDIGISFGDMYIFIEIKNYDDSRLGSSEIHRQLRNYNVPNYFTVGRYLYVYRNGDLKSPTVKSIRKVSNFLEAAKGNNFTVVIHPKLKSIIKLTDIKS